MNNLVYLKPNVAGEPLFDRWYAWAYLISPATAALNIKERHLKIMDSFIKSPKIHEAAVKTPAMLGGPFIDYPATRVEDVRVLRDRTMEKQKKMLDLANAITELNEMLLKNAKGYSIEPLYEMVPDLLKGYVELIYDLNNRPSFRLYEGLLYASEYYDPSSQSMAFQLVESDDSRSFVLSTPRLDQDNVVHLEIPFDHKGIDELYKMQRVPNSYEWIRDLLGVTKEQEPVFKTFFTEEAPAPYKRYDGPGIRTRYFGHACILVETNEISILVDPLVSYGYNSDLSRYTFEDLPEQIDYVLITHNHQDHVMYETLLRLRHKVKTVVVPRNSMGDLQDPSLRLNLKHVGFENVIELADMENITLPGCVITGLPFLGEHADLDVRSKLCYHVHLHNRFKVIFVADSCNVEPKVYENIHSILGNIDVLFLGMECDGAPFSWLYGPLMPKPLERDKDQTRRLAGSDCRKGMDLVDRFEPKDVFVYAMGMEPWLKYISSIKYTVESKPIVESSKLLKECQASGINAERLYGEKTLVY
jgi:L-ascorbate metabolism protein UlaG (beta-lactamase superfamily)